MTAHVHETAWYTHTSSTQTMRTWARVLESEEEVPEQFRQNFPDSSGDFPYTVLIPEDSFSLWNTRHGKIISLRDDHLILLEAFNNRVQTFYCPFTDILLLEYGKILLYSWLAINTPNESLRIQFNETNFYCFEPVIKGIRRGAHDILPGDELSADYQEQLAKFLPLMRTNYKYMNYGRQSIRRGDSVVKTAYQSERCLRTFTFLKKVLFRRYATNHLSILTDKELILIRENAPPRNSKKHLYGAVFRYIPLQKIRRVSLDRISDNSHKNLIIALPGGLGQIVDFADDNSDIDDFYQALRDIVGEFVGRRS